MKTEIEKIANIVPAKKLPKDLNQTFSYIVPENFEKEVEIGSLVEIPFRKSKIKGVVFSFSPKIETDFKIKKISKILDKGFLSKKNIEFIEYASAYYHSPLSGIIKMIVFDSPKKPARKDIDLAKSNSAVKKNNKSLLEEIHKFNKILLLHNLENQDKLELYKSIIQENKNGQNLILMPEYFDIYNSAQFFIDNFKREEVSIINSEITKNQFFNEWEKITNGKVKIIVGTRQAIFMPFKNLKNIIVDEEHSQTYKQWDQNPRYQARDLAIKMAEIFESKIILSSSTPSIESYLETQKNFRLIDITHKQKARPKIIDMGDERKSGNYSVISEKLKENLIETVYRKKQAIIFIPRMGEYTNMQCKDCGHTTVCDECENTLITYQGKMYCFKCKKEYELPTSCPKCKGQNLSSFGCGSSRVYEEIEKIFEGKNIKIKELNSQILKNTKSGQKIYKDFSKKRIDILVGTQMILKNWNTENLELIGVIFPEIIFSQNYFRSKEKIWQTLYKFYNLPINKNIFIQTYKPQNDFFKQMNIKSYKDFLKEELEERKTGISKIKYPPFGKIIKLIYKNQNPIFCEKEAKYQYKILKKEIENNNLQEEIEIISPFPAQKYKEFDKYRWHIIIRHKNSLKNETRDMILAKIKKDWIIDIDPDEIL